MKKFKFVISGNRYRVAVNEIEKNVAEVEVNGSTFVVEIEREQKTGVPTMIKKPAGKVEHVTTPSRVTGASLVKAPLPGSIIKVVVAVGQTVQRGDLLLTMESMKMENNIVAESAGVIKAILVQPGQGVMQGDNLVEMEGAVVDPVEKVAKPITTEVPKATAEPTQPTGAPSAASKASAVTAPLPGSIVKILVVPNQSVKRGDVVLTMESMKMENNIVADGDGTVKSVLVSVGQTVMQGDTLIEFA